jgi:hypothetical protein
MRKRPGRRSHRPIGGNGERTKAPSSREEHHLHGSTGKQIQFSSPSKKKTHGEEQSTKAPVNPNKSSLRERNPTAQTKMRTDRQPNITHPLASMAMAQTNRTHQSVEMEHCG